MIVLDCYYTAIEHYVNCLVLRWAGDWKSPLLSARINVEVIH